MFSLLLPEWQGCGVSMDVTVGARALAEAWWRHQPPDATIEPPPGHPARSQAGSNQASPIVTELTAIVDYAGAVTSRLTAAGPDRLTLIGGTCGVEVAPVAYLNARYGGNLAVVWLDGHADLNTPRSSPSGHFHGMALRTLLGDGPDALATVVARPLRPAQVLLVGARDLDAPERDYIAEQQVTWLPSEAFAEPRVLLDRLASKGFAHVYVHFDVDVVNPDDFGNALMTAPGGPPLAAVADVLSTLHRSTNVVGFSVLEYCDRRNTDRDRLVTALRAIGLGACCGDTR